MHQPIISIIAAISQNRVIGENNRVPWHIKEDLIRLKKLTQGQTVIIGRKTYDSMVDYYTKSGRQMPGKLYLVITRNQEYKPAFTNAQTVNSLNDAITKTKEYTVSEVFVIGGAQIFSQAMPVADKLYLTIVHTEIKGDAFFPDYSHFSTVISKQDGQSGNYHYTFLELGPQQED